MGSPNVLVNGKPALRVDDVGIQSACCGANMWQAQKGSATVFINGKAAFRINDPSQHCGGQGKLSEGSADVFVGDATAGGAGDSGRDRSETGRVGAGAGAGTSDARNGGAAAQGTGPAAQGPSAADDSSPDDEALADMTIELVDGIGHGVAKQAFAVRPTLASPQSMDDQGTHQYQQIAVGPYTINFVDVENKPVESEALPLDDSQRPPTPFQFSPLHRLTRREKDKDFLVVTGGHRRFLLEPRVGTLFELEHFRDRGAVFLPGRDPNPLRPGAPGDDRHRVTGTAAVAGAIAHGTATRGIEKLAITGHAAPPNDTTLSLQRARNAMLILTGDTTAKTGWPEDAAQSATVDDTNEVLAWIAARFNVDCDPTHPGALDRFIAGYNAFKLTTKNRSAPDLKSSDTAGGVGNANVWAAFLDFYFEDVARILSTTNEDARAQAAALQFFANDAPPPPPPPKKDPNPYLLIRRIDQVFPVKIAEITTGDANQWTQLNPLNPGSLLDPNNPSAGWRNMKPGERIYLPIPPQVPSEWGQALRSAGYDIRDENDADSDPQFDSNGRPLGYSHLIIRSTDSVWPVKLAEEAVNDANRFKELNPVNPHLMRGNNQWKDLYAGDKINLPTPAVDNGDSAWTSPAMRAKYQIVDEPPQKKKQQPPPDQSTTARATGCQAHHLDAPFVKDANRRGTQRRAEALFVKRRDEPLRICQKDDPACVTDSCDLYDPLEFELAYAKTDVLPLPLPRIVATFLHRVTRLGEADPIPRVCQPFRLRTDLAGPLPTAADLALIQWTCTVGEQAFQVPSPPGVAPRITQNGDKIRIDNVPDDWFGQTVTFSAKFPGQAPLPPAFSLFKFERSEATEYIALVRKVEAQGAVTTNARVAGALRRLAGLDTDLFQFLYGTRGQPEAELQADAALTAADLARLKQLSTLAQDDTTGTPLAMARVVSGISAGLQRKTALGFTVVAAATPLAFLRARASSLTLQIDNLYASTVAGDLGQSASQHFDGKVNKRVGPGSVASDEELVGDLDGFLIGRSMAPNDKVSDALARYYCVRGNSPQGVAQRFRAIAGQTPDLEKQTKHFSALFWMRKHARQMGAVRHIPSYPLERLVGEIKPTLDDYHEWLDGKKPDELKWAQLADAADQADAAEKFPQ